ncbi:barstar family protein, partial [Lysobacter sp. 2RAB21]
LADAAADLDYAVARADFAGCAGKDEALQRIARALRFPEWFGGNWDALNDSVNDLSWWPAPGYLLLIEHAGTWQSQYADEATILVEILNDAAQDWAKARVAFWALLPLPAADLAKMAP